MALKYKQIEQVAMAKRRGKILEECCKIAEYMPLDLWDVVKEASMKIRKVLMYEQ
tara:strand:- start:40 stop:204 length:165 start_codon:yes stop_codon:yes gene_type:complete